MDEGGREMCVDLRKTARILDENALHARVRHVRQFMFVDQCRFRAVAATGRIAGSQKMPWPKSALHPLPLSRPAALSVRFAPFGVGRHHY